jgi:hypothetical protein
MHPAVLKHPIATRHVTLIEIFMVPHQSNSHTRAKRGKRDTLTMW